MYDELVKALRCMEKKMDCMSWHIWHNTNGQADQYFICRGYRVYWQIPHWLGRWILRKEKKHEQNRL